MNNKFIYESSSTRRVISVLKSFTPERPKLTASEIYKGNELSKATALRILSTLTQEGLLDYDLSTRRYKIGMEVYFLGSMYLSTTDIIVAAEPVTEALNIMTSEAVNVSILNKGYVTIILKQEPQHPFRWGVHIGKTSPAYCSSMGKAILSDYSDEEIDAIYPEENLQKMAAKTVSTRTALKRELEEIRRTGVAFNIEGDIQGINGVGAAIRDNHGRSIAGVSFSFPIFRTNEARLKSLAKLIRMGASLISYRLGYRDPNNQVRDIKELHSWWEQNKSSSFESYNQDQINLTRKLVK